MKKVTNITTPPKLVPSKNLKNQNYIALFLCIFLMIYFWIVCKKTEGYYQHDEITHFYQIINFWNNPLLYILNLWSRGGYKILYAIPGTFGENAVIFTNIFFTSASCYIAYLIAKKYNFKYPLLAIIFTGLQAFIINLSFRCYPEVPCMFFTVLMSYTYINKKFILTALIASFLFTIRQEMAVFAIILGFVFLFQRKWIPFLLLAIFPLALNILGWLSYGDPIYVLNMFIKGGIQDTYQRNGFFYFWIMLPEICGIVIFYFFLLTGVGFLLDKNKWSIFKKYHSVLVVFCVFFLMHCIFTSKSFGFGRSGGVGRFMIVISPMIAIIATGGLNYLISNRALKYRLLTICLTMAVIISFFTFYDTLLPKVFNSYETVSSYTENMQSIIIALASCLLFVIIPASRKSIYVVLCILPLLYSFLCIKPVQLNAEDAILRDAANWVETNLPNQKVIYSYHIVFQKFYDLAGGDYNKLQGYDSTTIVKAKPGDVFVFENHYAIKQVNGNLFNTGRFKILKDFGYQGVNFQTYVLQK